MRTRVTLLSLLLAGFGCACHAQQSINDGPTYPIAEEDLLMMIQRRLLEKERTGELRRLQTDAIKRSKQAVLQPRSLALPAATRSATKFFDPTYVLDRNILDSAGNILFVAGTRTNPLDIVPMTKRLLFFDGSDARQVQFARQAVMQFGDRLKPVLTGGSFIQLMKEWRVPVYYDQQGLLTTRLGVTHVPAWAYQDGKRIRIDEVVLK